MAKPPETPPSSDIDGVHRDRVHRLSPKTMDAQAQAQTEAEAEENAGRPSHGADRGRRSDPNVGVGN